MDTYIKAVLLAILFANLIKSSILSTITIGEIWVELVGTDYGITFAAKRDGDTILSGMLQTNKNMSGVNCIGSPNCHIEDYIMNITKIQNGLIISWETQNTEVEFRDCFDFQNGSHWYGGPQRYVQRWPLEKMQINGSEPYVVKKSDNSGVAERYWLNSEGVYIYLDEKTPLFVDQNQNETKQKVCFIAAITGPYVYRKRNILQYTIIVKENAKEAHLHAINNYLGKPVGHPNAQMIREPIWTTWAKYKTDITDDIVLDFAKEIRNHGYENGQLEIDDNWEVCYGAQEFSKEKFANISNTVAALKKDHFRVTLWVHPFVNSDCQNNSNEGYAKGYFVEDINGTTNGSWWRGENAHQIDFTNQEAALWYSTRIRKLQENPGLDGFKFDAGESDYGPQPSVYKNVDVEKVPNILSESYVRTCAEFGTLIEVRSAWRTQDLPIFVRMLDKDSAWDENNGLYTLVTTLLQMNMNGYTMVLPDMIGGNGYNGSYPTAELIVRWSQANTFMPTMQFSYLPWDITTDEFDAAAIVKKFVELHSTFSYAIIEAMEASIKNGHPVNAPIWWIDPTDPQALACDTEFLLGDNILVAPVIVEGDRSRDIYLPKGNWSDGNNGSIYEGPKLISGYPAPIDLLPYFHRIVTK